MLVLTRKSNQSIMIGDEIEITVLSISREKVRIGIQAPQSVRVLRKEIYGQPPTASSASGHGPAVGRPATTRPAGEAPSGRR